jgi:hypothetical protein
MVKSDFFGVMDPFYKALKFYRGSCGTVNIGFEIRNYFCPELWKYNIILIPSYKDLDTMLIVCYKRCFKGFECYSPQFCFVL